MLSLRFVCCHGNHVNAHASDAAIARSKVQVTFHRSRVQVIAPSINYQTTQIPLDLIEHFVKSLGLGDSFNAVHLSLSW